MNTITITITEYAQLYGCTPRNVAKNLSNDILMPFMRNIRRSGATWLVDVEKSWYDSKQTKGV